MNAQHIRAAEGLHSDLLRSIRLGAEFEGMLREVQFPEECAVCGLPSYIDVPCWEGEPSPRNGGAMHMRWPEREEHEGIEPEREWAR